MNEVIDNAYLLKCEMQGRSVKSIPFHNLDRAGPSVHHNSFPVSNETSDAISLLKEPRYQFRAYVTTRTNNQYARADLS
jgi:hypothetical protein